MDRLESLLERDAVQQVLTRYAVALDTHQPERMLSEVFAEDAVVDYSAAGGIQGNPRELVSWLGEAMSVFNGWQHLLGNFVIEVEGERANTRTECFNPLHSDTTTILVGCCYHDELAKRDGQWRIVNRRLSVAWMREWSSG